jgi:hypothetical protein
MIDRQQLESILGRRFPGAPLDQIAAAANAIMGLDGEARGRKRHDRRRCRCAACRRKGALVVPPPLPSTTA